jgi:hypothetical protein
LAHEINQTWRATEVGLNEVEVKVLTRGTTEWGSGFHPSTELCVSFGFRDETDLITGGAALAEKLRDDVEMTAKEWTQLLLLTETAFISDVFGVGTEWYLRTGLGDDLTIEALRSIQDKMTHQVIMLGHFIRL